MSKVGKKPIEIPEGVSLEVKDEIIKITGPKGSLSRKLPKRITLEEKDGQIFVFNQGKSKKARAMHGTTRAHLANMAKGVSQGWSKTLELVGTGYRVEGGGNTITLAVGFSHPVKIDAPEGIEFKVAKTEITIEGIDKNLVGQVAASIRAIRPPEPYKGKGIRYKDEVVRRKPGKAAKGAGEGAAG